MFPTVWCLNQTFLTVSRKNKLKQRFLDVGVKLSANQLNQNKNQNLTVALKLWESLQEVCF